MAEAPSPPSHSPSDIFDGLSPPSQPENKWPTLSPASTIPPTQKVPSLPASWKEKLTQKSQLDYNLCREKYEKYFEGNRIHPIPELIKEVQPKTISFVITDVRTRRLAGIKKDTFEELLRAANIPAKYYCRRSFATWDVLMPSEEQTAKLAGGNITSKYFRLQPEYMGRRRIKITVCNVPIALNEDVLAAYLIKYGNIEAINKAKSTNGTAHGDYVFTMCLDRGGFTAIPHTISYEDRAMTVVVEGRKPQCWNCKQLGHISKSCPQKTTKTTPTTTTPIAKTTTTITAAAAAAATVAEPNETSKAKTGDSPDKEEDWTQVQRSGKKKKSPVKTTENQNTTATTIPTDTAVTTTTTTKTASSSSSSSSSTTKKAKEKTKEKTKENKGKDEDMDYSTNLKRRRDSGNSIIEEAGKKHIKKPPQTETQTQSQTPSLPQPKGEKKITRPERPAQIIPPPQSTPAHLPDFPFSPKTPSLSPVTSPNLRSHSATRETTPPALSLPIVQKQRSRSATSEVRRALTAFHFCEDILQPQNLDHVVKKSLKPLLSFKTVDSKDITNPYLFQDAPMLATFVRSAGNRTKELRQFIDDASRTDLMLADTKNSMLRKMLPFCSGRDPILVHPSFYRSLKLRYPVDVGGITRDDQVSTELGTGSLRQAVGILTSKDFRPVVDTE